MKMYRGIFLGILSCWQLCGSGLNPSTEMHSPMQVSDRNFYISPDMQSITSSVQSAMSIVVSSDQKAINPQERNIQGVCLFFDEEYEDKGKKRKLNFNTAEEQYSDFKKTRRAVRR